MLKLVVLAVALAVVAADVSTGAVKPMTLPVSMPLSMSGMPVVSYPSGVSPYAHGYSGIVAPMHYGSYGYGYPGYMGYQYSSPYYSAKTWGGNYVY